VIVLCILILSFFFFSSRSRHTRFSRDWSSDVCSSDLVDIHVIQSRIANPDYLSEVHRGARPGAEQRNLKEPRLRQRFDCFIGPRSEERRVGKEGKEWRARDGERKKNYAGQPIT